MVQTKKIVACDGTGWMALYESLADAIVAYAEVSKREQLLDLLAFALDECKVSFPIMHSGEELNSIDPFTLFSSFNWSYSAEQRTSLIFALATQFGVDITCDEHNDNAAEKLPYNSAVVRQTLGHDFFIEERELRFFTFTEQRSEHEINLLWELFSAALAFADTQSKSKSVQARFAKAYDEILRQRVKGAQLITTALHWIRPNFYVPVNTRVGAYGAAILGYAYNFFAQSPTAEDYLHYLDDCSLAIANRSFGEDVDAPCSLVHKAWRSTDPAAPRLDKDKTKALLTECCGNYAAIHKNNSQLWRAVRCFQDHWNNEASDFACMLKESLAQHGTLLATSGLYNPHQEILLFARREPEAVRSAFAALFERSTPLSMRLLAFDEAATTLHERYREDLLRAYAKRSSHGNFMAIATYLFLRYPEESYLYSPLHINALVLRVGYSATIRVALPQSVEQYYELCNQIQELVAGDEKLLAAAERSWDSSTEYLDLGHHLLVEDIVASTL